MESTEEEIYSLWVEYEQGITAEAIVAKQLDKLEMIVQADEYEKGEHLIHTTILDIEWTLNNTWYCLQLKEWCCRVSLIPQRIASATRRL